MDLSSECGTSLPAATSCWGFHFLLLYPRCGPWAAPQQGRAGPIPALSGHTQSCADPAKKLPTSLSISTVSIILHTFLFGFFWVLQKETLWEVLTPFSEPREMIWPRPGEARKTCSARMGVDKLL